MTSDLAARLRDALTTADYTYDAVAALIGTTAQVALGRNETTPGLRATTGGSPLETLVRMWLLQATVPADQAERALPGLVDDLCAAGILERSVSEVAARASAALRSQAIAMRSFMVVEGRAMLSAPP